jgi:hypothetical protein
MEKRPLRKRINELVFHASRYTELVISVIILLVIAALVVALVYDLTNMPLLHMTSEYFTQFLARALSLVVGVEFVKMLCKHTPETLVEVLMFATARQMVVEHLATWETLIGILAIAILFAVRKYLFLHPGAANTSDTFEN